MCKIENFVVFYTCKTQTKSEGISVLIRDNIVCSKAYELCRCNDSIELCVAKMSLDDGFMIIVGIHRPHDLHPSLFIGIRKYNRKCKFKKTVCSQ